MAANAAQHASDDVGAFAHQTVTVMGRRLQADVSGALYWPSENMLIVSDLHLEKGSARAHRGRFLPPYDTRETLMRLAAVIDRYRPDTVISLGDSFHDDDGCDRISTGDLAIIEVMQETCDWLWVTGNHDPHLSARVGGRIVDEVVAGGLAFRHEPKTVRATHEVAGHLHPAAKLAVHGATLRRPCFVGNGQRLVMPAFGAFTGGLNVLDEAFEPLFSEGGFAVWMRGAEGLYPVSTRQLVRD